MIWLFRLLLFGATLGTLQYDQDRYPEALGALRRFTALDPKAGPGWALLGLCEFETKQYQPAGEHLERARKVGIASNPQLNEVALFHEALLLTRLEKYEAVIQILIGFARRGQDKPAMVEAVGIAALRKPLLPAESGDLQQGIKELELSKQQAPDNPQTRIALGSAYAKAGRPENAARERAEFLKLKQLSKKPEEP